MDIIKLLISIWERKRETEREERGLQTSSPPPRKPSRGYSAESAGGAQKRKFRARFWLLLILVENNAVAPIWKGGILSPVPFLIRNSWGFKRFSPFCTRFSFLGEKLCSENIFPLERFSRRFSQTVSLVIFILIFIYFFFVHILHERLTGKPFRHFIYFPCKGKYRLLEFCGGGGGCCCFYIVGISAGSKD